MNTLLAVLFSKVATLMAKMLMKYWKILGKSLIFALRKKKIKFLNPIAVWHNEIDYPGYKIIVTCV